MREMIIAGLFSVLASGPVVAEVSPGAAAEFPACLARLKTEAINAGVDRVIVAKALDGIEIDDRLLAVSEAQPEFKTPIWDYLAFLVDEQRIVDGRTMLAEHDDLLRAIEAHFGVDRHVVTAVWGVETDYGKDSGRHYLPHALANLTCLAERRTKFWRGELIEALTLVDRGDLALDKLYGSWAGAFGQTQFIPSTYARLAVDFDGDGRRDLVDSIPDALASTANYLKRAGWQSGRPWMIEVKAPADYAGPVGRKQRLALDDWNARGIRRADGAQLKGKARTGLLLPAGPAGPGFLVFDNFDAIYAYNHAESYAIAISHLADRLAGYPALRTPWPTDDPGLSRAERLELQELLVAEGYDIGEVDGRVGPRTRAAVAEHEKKLGWPETGRAGRKIFKALKGD
ncbi:MAG: lytic murein transglycosylase [Gammaproteobacteria bacterium]|nr:lytic murein transglycosylase [Gammaproteobacteria bacterium]